MSHPSGARISQDRAIPEKAEPFAKRGRKAADLPSTEMAELPKESGILMAPALIIGAVGAVEKEVSDE